MSAAKEHSALCLRAARSQRADGLRPQTQRPARARRRSPNEPAAGSQAGQAPGALTLPPRAATGRRDADREAAESSGRTLTCRTSRLSPAGSTQLTSRSSRSMRAEVPRCFNTRPTKPSFFFKNWITCGQTCPEKPDPRGRRTLPVGFQGHRHQLREDQRARSEGPLQGQQGADHREGP